MLFPLAATPFLSSTWSTARLQLSPAENPLGALVAPWTCLEAALVPLLSPPHGATHAPGGCEHPALNHRAARLGSRLRCPGDTGERLFNGRAESLWGRPRPRQMGRAESGSHCILLENIDIYFSSQLELNTILPGLKKKQKNKTFQKCPQPHAYLPLPSALGWVSRYARPSLPSSLPRRLVPEGREESQSWAGPRRSHLINLGWGSQMKRTEKGKEPRLNCPR